jgi:hypothetical protein
VSLDARRLVLIYQDRPEGDTLLRHFDLRRVRIRKTRYTEEQFDFAPRLAQRSAYN